MPPDYSPVRLSSYGLSGLTIFGAFPSNNCADRGICGSGKVCWLFAVLFSRSTICGMWSHAFLHLLFFADERERVSVDAVQVPQGNTVRITYGNVKAVGTGSFGVVYAASLSDGREVAVKKVLQDERYKVINYFRNKFLTAIASQYVMLMYLLLS